MRRGFQEEDAGSFLLLRRSVREIGGLLEVRISHLADEAVFLLKHRA